MIQLSLLETARTDPEFCALWASVLAFRRYADDFTVGGIFEQALQLNPSLREPGPVGNLLTRLQGISWSFVILIRFFEIIGECLLISFTLRPKSYDGESLKDGNIRLVPG